MRYQKNLSRIFISMTILVLLASSLYLNFAWKRYQEMAEAEACQLAHSVASLMHVEHIESLMTDDISNHENLSLIEESLISLVEVTEPIYYAYIMQERDGKILVIADSSSADTPSSSPTRRNCEETEEINHLVFDNGQAIVTNPIKSKCGEWIRALVPIKNQDKKVVALLGLSYSATEWKAALWEKMIPDILITLSIIALVFTLFILIRKNHILISTEKMRLESERSKLHFFSHIPGMAFRCKNDQYWTMEFVSKGSLELTGYEPEEMIDNKAISYNEIIAPGYRAPVRDRWERALLQAKGYHGEYEIITKDGKRKWVLELGSGVFDEEGNLEALEGLIMDLSEVKERDLQIAYLKKHDFLTGLYNRNYMEEEKKRLDKPEFWPLSIAICDIDGLRMVNDAYGHEEGDYLIRKTGQLIKDCLDPKAVLSHTGAGEFMILLPNTDTLAASNLKSKIKDSINSYNRSNKNALYAISLSIGFSSKENNEQEIQDILTEADEHLKRRKLLNRHSSHSAIVSSFMASLYAKSQETEEHGQRLGEFCKMIGQELNLSQSDLDDLQLLAKLHDIGKIGIDDNILNKPGKLSEEEWKTMKQHPEIGHRIVMTTSQLRHIADHILHHHERWDGSGYPAKLKGDDIPLLARILSVADAFDAMTEDRIYRKALSKEEALKEIEDNAGSQFDPNIAQIFMNLIRAT